ncbi:MAG TPA: hypothetical protein VN696_18175 [Pyrinomonadaceae bacterium]|nr:hypothetical protein [Pyrinomonadaceae bacterium]
MKIARHVNKLLAAAFFGAVLLLVMPATSMAQGRGHGRGQGPNWDKKCAKFVNCHDARDGRVDGRGPARGTGISNIYRNRRYTRTTTDDIIYGRGRTRTRRVDRDRDGDYGIYGRTRTRRIDRDGDGDYDRNDVRLERQRRAERRYRRSNP